MIEIAMVTTGIDMVIMETMRRGRRSMGAHF